jgi:hypothetical protein
MKSNMKGRLQGNSTRPFNLTVLNGKGFNRKQVELGYAYPFASVVHRKEPDGR